MLNVSNQNDVKKCRVGAELIDRNFLRGPPYFVPHSFPTFSEHVFQMNVYYAGDV